MRQRRTPLLVGGLLGIFLSVSVAPAYAQSESADYGVGISTKFGRGLVNVLSSPAEIPCTIRDEVSERGAAGAGTGFFLGTWYFVRRALVGVTEVGTFMIPMEATIPPVCAKKAEAAVE
jgi:putative exosortase-associated protein (TIGR04073 family)